MKLKSLILIVGFFLFIGLMVKAVWADQCDPSCSSTTECQAKIDECQKLLQISVNATKPSADQMANLEKDISAIDANVKSLTDQIYVKKSQIAANEDDLASKSAVFDAQVREFYKKNSTSELEYFLTTLLSGNNFSDSVQLMGYRQSLIDQQKKVIVSIVLEVNDLQNARKNLEDTQNWLTAKKANLEVTLAPIRDLVNRARAYQQQLSQTVGTLSARQQELLAEKTGNFSTSVGDVPDTMDPNSSIEGFRSNAPAGSFAGFSFGAPHFKGMSQYGAWGRAKSGQSAEDILHAYYGGIEIKKDYSTSININVQGYGSYNIEDYVKRIYEMPSSWTDNNRAALMAQAVAARSYALAYTNNGSGSICATESCQVFQPNDKGGDWDAAVDATRGWVLVVNGQPFSAWYAASAGGYIHSYSAGGWTTPGGWDTKCGSQSCWTNDAYEKIAGSPWFYKAWYKPRYSAATRPNAWLSKDEFVDIVNAYLMYMKDNNTLNHLSQTDKPTPDTWSRDELRNNLGGSAINDVYSVSVTYSTSGYTSNVHMETDKGPMDLNANIFKDIFNTRAPGEIHFSEVWKGTPGQGPAMLFNIEHK